MALRRGKVLSVKARFGERSFSIYLKFKAALMDVTLKTIERMSKVNQHDTLSV